MRARRTTFALGLAALAVGAGPAEAFAGGVGSWSRVTPEADNDILTDVGITRAGPGELHVAYRVRDAADPLKKDLVYARLRASDGTTIARTTVLEDWSAITNPAIVQQPDGALRIVFSGLRSTSTEDPYSAGDLYSATSDAAGSAWTLQPGALSPRSAYVSGAVGATTAGDGTLVSAYAPGEVVATIGTAGGDAADRIFQTSCCGYAANVARDSASGSAVLGWFSNATGQNGVLVKDVHPTHGSETYLPGSADEPGRNQAVSLSDRVAMTGRSNGQPGVAIAYCQGYPTCTTVRLWRHDLRRAVLVSSADGASYVGVASAPLGRVWSMWQQGGRVLATRSNRAATRFGAVVSMQLPAGQQLYGLQGEAEAGPLGVYAALAEPGGTATWHTQLVPGLTLAGPTSVRTGGRPRRVSFRITDAGDPVAGAQIRRGGRSFVSDATGRVRVTLAAGRRRVTLTATRAGYRRATLAVRTR